MRKALFIHISILAAFLANMLGPLPLAHAQDLRLPAPGTMVNLSPAYEPVIIKGLTVHKDNPFLFDFIVDVGQDKMSGEPLKKEGEKLIKYFLASLAIPDKDVWVNLSPYEKNKMIPEALGQTDMGRDLLKQDYILKQITASLIYPEKDLGKKFWDKVYSKSQQMYGTTRIPVNTFNKVWIMADRAEVFEHNQTAFVVGSHMKVMLEEDYLALQKHSITSPRKDTHSIGADIVREIILPELEKEVNTGKNFANLRQILNSLILANWYKNNLKQALLNQVYTNQNKIKGINLNDPTIKQQIYEQYLKAYKKGVFNYIKEESSIPRKYFSGGFDEAQAVINPAVTTDSAAMADSLPDRALVSFETGLDLNKQVDAAMSGMVQVKDFGAIVKRMVGGQRTLVFLNERTIAFEHARVDFSDGVEKGEIYIERTGPHKYFIHRFELLGSVYMNGNYGGRKYGFIFGIRNSKFVLILDKQERLLPVELEINGTTDMADQPGQLKIIDVPNGGNIKIKFAGQSIALSYRDKSLFLDTGYQLNAKGSIIFKNRYTDDILEISGRPIDAVGIRDLSKYQTQLFYQPVQEEVQAADPVKIDRAMIVDDTKLITSGMFKGLPDAVESLAGRALWGEFLLLRINQNVPSEALPLLNFLLIKGVHIILIGQQGSIEDHQSLESTAKFFQEKYRDFFVKFYEHSVSENGLNISTEELKNDVVDNGRGSLQILENLSFAPNAEQGEKASAGRREFVHQLSLLANIFIMEDYGDIGSDSASIEDLPKEFSRPGKEFFIGPSMIEDAERSASTDKAVLTQPPGGIDLNTSSGMRWKISKDGSGVEMNIDPAMIERAKREGISSLSPVIFRITPIASVWLLVGLEAPVKNS